MKHRGLKFLFLLLSLALLVGLLSGMSAYAEEYPIWVGKTQVTSENASDILGNGTVKYDANTKTLTLDGFSLTADDAFDVFDNGSGYTGCIRIGSSSDSITIELKGANTLTNNINYGCGIFSESALTFSGSGSLNASGKLYGIYSNSNITVKSGNITADGNYYGLDLPNGVIEIRGGTVTANGNAAGISSAIFSSTVNGIIITGGTVTANGRTGGTGLLTAMSSVKIDGGTVTASGSTGISSMDGELQINGGIVIASGSQGAIGCKVKNTIAGTGWTNTAGTEGKTTIAVNTQGQDLKEPGYKKVQFPAAADSFTVTYIDSTGTNEKREFGPYEAGYEYKIEGGSIFPKVPQGKEFDGWKDSNGTPYTENTIVKLNSALTLYAQWKDASQGGDSDGGSSSGGVDLVFNIPGADDSWEYVGGGYAPQQAYRVSLAPMQGGSAALGLTTGDSGTALNVYPTSAVYVFPNANPGYTLDKIVWSMIDGSASYDITEAKNFIMPAMDVVVYVTFRPMG